MVEDHQGRLVLPHGGGDLLEFAAADETARIRPMAMAKHEGDRITPGREHELLEFPRILPVTLLVELEVDEDRTLPAIGALEEHDYSTTSSSSAPAGGPSRTGREGTTVETACL